MVTPVHTVCACFMLCVTCVRQECMACVCRGPSDSTEVYPSAGAQVLTALCVLMCGVQVRLPLSCSVTSCTLTGCRSPAQPHPHHLRPRQARATLLMATATNKATCSPGWARTTLNTPSAAAAVTAHGTPPPPPLLLQLVVVVLLQLVVACQALVSMQGCRVCHTCSLGSLHHQPMHRLTRTQ